MAAVLNVSNNVALNKVVVRLSCAFTLEDLIKATIGGRVEK